MTMQILSASLLTVLRRCLLRSIMKGMLGLQLSCKTNSNKSSVVNSHFPVQGGHHPEAGTGGQTVCRAEGAG